MVRSRNNACDGDAQPPLWCRRAFVVFGKVTSTSKYGSENVCLVDDEPHGMCRSLVATLLSIVCSADDDRKRRVKNLVMCLHRRVGYSGIVLNRPCFR